MLARAVQSALNQTYPELRVDIYDNASGDETAEVAAALVAADSRVHYHRREANLGLVENFAQAQAEVETEYFSFLADDDLLLPDFHARAVVALDANPEAMFVASPVLFVDNRGRILSIEGAQWASAVHQPPAGMLELVRRGHFVWTGTMFRRAATVSAGTLDPRAGVCADLDFQLRIAGTHAFATLPDPGAIFSWHEASATSLPRLAQFWPTWQVIAAGLERERAIPESARRQAARELSTRLPRKVFLAGMLASSQGRTSEAKQAAEVLARELGRPAQAAMIGLVEATCHRLPPLRGGLGKLGDWIRWRHRVSQEVQDEFDRKFRDLLALPAASPPTRRKDSAA